MKEASYFRMALDALREPLFIVEQSLSCSFINTAFSELLGIDPKKLPLVSEFWPEGKKYTEHPILDGEDISSTFHLATGETLSVKLNGNILPSDPRCMMFRVVAIGAKNEHWHEFHQQRLETLGLLAGGVAHDFNNLLTGILGHITFLKTILPPSGSHIESLLAIESGAKRSSGLTQQILHFSKQDQGQDVHVLDLGPIVTRTCSLLRGAISPEYQFLYQVSTESIPVMGMESKMTQIIANLVINARDAVKTNGHIEVGVEILDDLDRIQKAFPNPLPSHTRYARLFVIDDGEGMSSDLQERIFDPFFTTKKGKGTGLGLTTVASIVRSMRGSIDISSQMGVGTSVSVYFPIYEPEPGDIFENEDEPGLRKGTERVLVVDDEFPVRNVIALSLEHLGYTVDTAASGMEAIERFRQDPVLYDLVVLDMLMPEMPGEEVFIRLQRMHPEVRVLIISGFTSEESIRRILANGGKDYIQKPFTIHELSQKVRKSIDS